MGKRRILQIINYLYPNIGGIEQVGRDIANVLSNNENIEQKIICFNEDAQDAGYVCRRKQTLHDRIDGVEVVRCGCIAKVASQSISLTYPRELKQILHKFEPDIVILHYPNPYVTTFLLPLLGKNTKLVVYWHSDITRQKWLGKLFQGQNRRLLERANRIVATSPNYIEGSPYLQSFKNKCVVIPNCINQKRLIITEAIEKKASAIKKQYQGKTICFAVGRHVPYKGMSYLVQAGKFLSDDFVILIGGKGELTETLKKEAGDDKKIKFIGRIPDEEMATYFQACDIFAFPSITKNEAFGIALAEGMYFGKPAVTFTIPGSGVNYVNLNGETGIECPNGDSREYALALEKIAKDEVLRKQYGNNARKRVTENFLYDQFEVHIGNLIAELSVTI
jgi:rhamnosyl/mannosyltransferase